MSDNTQTLGDKIKFYRKRAGLSQLELETRIEASPGSLSRIENGQINPTKETLIKIIDVLRLDMADSANLFNIPIKDSSIKFLKSTKFVTSSLELSRVLQHAVDEIVLELDFLAGFIVLVRGDKIYAQTSTDNWATRVSMKFMPGLFTDLNVPLSDKHNLMVKAVVEKEAFFSNDYADFIVPAVSVNFASIMKRLTGVKSGIAVPILFEDQAIGAISFGRRYESDFKNELEAIELFADHVGIAIHNAQQYEKLQKSLVE
jgi:transcriptional regulator with XRE-family HTH domain